MMIWSRRLSLLVILAIISACGPTNTGNTTLEVSGAWVRAAKAMEAGGHEMMETPAAGNGEGMGANSAAYMLLRNHAFMPDKLLRVESDVAQAVELHMSELQGEVMTMRPIAFVIVPAGGEAELQPGGTHVMLIGIKRDLTPGEKITLKLVFENAGTISTQAEVRAP